MINLLPPELRESYRYARRNTMLRSWVVVALISLVGLGALGTFGLLSLHQESVTYSRRVTAAQKQLEDDHLAQTETRVKDITNSLKLGVQVLSQEVLFSKLITQIGAAMPSGTVLTGLNINKSQGGLDLTANATNYTTATQIQVNLNDPNNKIFGKVDLNGINCSQQTGGDALHPCAVTLRALFNSDNQFLFINQGKKS